MRAFSGPLTPYSTRGYKNVRSELVDGVGWHGHPMLGDRASLGTGTVTQRRVAVPPNAVN